MSFGIESLFQQYHNTTIALYGLGTETERAIIDFDGLFDIVGLLDGFRTEGEMYGYPIISLDELIHSNVRLIIVVARPGSCKVITRRIGDFCREHDIELFDIRGRDLLAETPIKYDFNGFDAGTKDELIEKIVEADVVSIDLFDTLITRKASSYTDVFELLGLRFKKDGVNVADFCRVRLQAEKELSKSGSPRLDKIYTLVVGEIAGLNYSAEKLAEAEWKIDHRLIIPRKGMTELLSSDVMKNKIIVITTDSYYRKEQIIELLNRNGINGYEKVYVSSEYDTFKSQMLFDRLLSDYTGKKILHIGDDIYSDIESAKKYGIDTFKIFSGMELFEVLGEMGIGDKGNSLSDRIRRGLFISRIFNDPFVFESEHRMICVSSEEDIGYCFCASMITDFCFWLKNRAIDQGLKRILLGARDGWLIKKLFEIMDTGIEADYFLCSRTAAIRAGMTDDKDIEYVRSMKYAGTPADERRVRFGIETDDSEDMESIRKTILETAEKKRKNYRKYIEGLEIGQDRVAFFDFVAKGTTQMYVQRLLSQRLKGFYFLQLEPEFMADKNLEIEPFYSEEEKNGSAIFDNYYILETILTSPDPQLLEFDSDGKPIYATETRSETEISCIIRIQDGIIEYFMDYIGILGIDNASVNKALSEAFLSLIGKIWISDPIFTNMKVEDQFFGRMTDMKDLF